MVFPDYIHLLLLSYIKHVRTVHRRKIVFGTIFKHVVLLVTEILRQELNFRNTIGTEQLYMNGTFTVAHSSL